MPSTITWLGTADAVAQVSTGAIASVDATPSNNTFTVTIGGVAITVTGTVSANATAAALVAALAASTHPYFAAVTWTNPSGANITGTATTAGIPFTATISKAGGGTGTVTAFSTTTANAGPNALIAANMSTGVLPVNGDTFIIEKNSTPILWNLDALSAVTLAELRVPMDYTGLVGLDNNQFCTSVSGINQTYSTTRKPEYRPCSLVVSTTTAFNYGQGTGSGAARFRIDFGSHQFTGLVEDTCANTVDADRQPLRIIGTHASNVLKVYGGIVGVATSTGAETSTLTSVEVHGGTVTLSSGVDWLAARVIDSGTLIVNNVSTSGSAIVFGGKLVLNATTGKQNTLNIYGGEAELNGSFDAATVGANGGVLTLNNSGTFDAVGLDGGTIDASGSVSTVIATAFTLGNAGGRIIGLQGLGIIAFNFGQTVSMGATFGING